MKDFAIIGNRRFAPARGWLQAEKPNLHGPGVVLGILAVKRNLVICRILGRSIDGICYLGSRRMLIEVAHQFRSKDPRDLLELRHFVEIKIPEEYSSVL